MTSINQSY